MELIYEMDGTQATIWELTSEGRKLYGQTHPSIKNKKKAEAMAKDEIQRVMDLMAENAAADEAAAADAVTVDPTLEIEPPVEPAS